MLGLAFSMRISGMISRVLSQDFGRERLFGVLPLATSWAAAMGEGTGDDLENPGDEGAEIFPPMRNCSGTAVWLGVLGVLTGVSMALRRRTCGDIICCC
ncbi:hypothetical protein B0T22DRAFT_453999 [Podospora appendiculata]|uniref:Uncharacterized protein n=1 Tax=Podospora appendiculata TaxID=314037 RepID=A0AAE0XKA8_9PEZI|nr:hypothetical protein B0T22DRAFT_453999 [Podospora appendiculata]